MARHGVTGIFVGRSTLDIVYACDRLPAPDAKVDAAAGYLAGGGPALNAAAAFAHLGGTARLCSVVGAGPMADVVLADLDGAGVELFDAAEGRPGVLPVSSVILTGAHRAIVNQPLPAGGAEAPAALLERLFSDPPDVVLSDGHLPELAAPVLRRAREAGAVTVLDGGSWKPWTATLLPLVDIAVVSSRFRWPDGPAVSVVATTDGPHPIRWRAGAASGEIRPPQVEAVDTLGAGDVFHGAFCHAYALTRDFPASLAAAAEVAARSTTAWGPRLSTPPG
jgi:sugar/nucleoside kinase (ribokinase family)